MHEFVDPSLVEGKLICFFQRKSCTLPNLLVAFHPNLETFQILFV